MVSVVSNHQPATAPGFVLLANVAQQTYVSELLSFTLDRLHKEPELLRVDSERLRRKMKEVAVGSYRTFITAVDALQSVKEEVSSIDKHLESLNLESQPLYLTWLGDDIMRLDISTFALKDECFYQQAMG